jgi:hypothetical protein
MYCQEQAHQYPVVAMGYFSTRQRLWQPSRSRLLFLLIAIVAFALTEFGRYAYRPWVNECGIDDFGFANSVGNLGGIVVQVFLGLAILNPTRLQSYRLAAFFSAGYILYEFVQPYLPKGVFDWGDVLATVIGFGISALLTVWRSVGVEEETG